MKIREFLSITSQISEEDFVALYNNHDLTIKQIAKELNISATTIEHYVRHLGLVHRHPYRTTRINHHRKDNLPDTPWWLSLIVVDYMREELEVVEEAIK